MYHLELRQSFHNFNHFNVNDEELRALIEPWVREQAIELGERKWSPQQAKLRILEGPHLPIEELSLGRGWRTAEREGKDVTERVFAEAKQTLQAGAQQAASAPQAAAAGEPADRLLALLGADPAALLAAWRLAAERRPELAPSEALALAEATLTSLDRSQP
jgi:hypothetical protein